MDQRRSARLVRRLTKNNGDRGGDERPTTDAANPRANNTMGNIVFAGRTTATSAAPPFVWNHFVLAGDRPGAR